MNFVVILVNLNHLSIKFLIENLSRGNCVMLSEALSKQQVLVR